MNNFSLYCKSYKNDVLRAKRLLQSILKFNKDNIPFYISTPIKDKDLFFDTLGSENFHWISDESICLSNPKATLDVMYALPGNISQQVVKSEFWRLKLCENYLCLDSDAQFIRPFYLKDFLTIKNTPYTIMHKGEDLINDAKALGHQNVIDDFYRESNELKKEFNRLGDDFDFGPPPMIWSAKVWSALSNYLENKNQTIWDAIRRQPAEIRWYGEALLHINSIEVHRKQPLFKFYHYEWQYKYDNEKQININALKNRYLGIVYQSNWDRDYDLPELKKSKLSILWGNFKLWLKS